MNRISGCTVQSDTYQNSASDGTVQEKWLFQAFMQQGQIGGNSILVGGNGEVLPRMV
ncbi:MAG: hypothetical protein WA705_14940 [Candidatus Ozemobacteraceae bacterium]